MPRLYLRQGPLSLGNVQQNDVFNLDDGQWAIVTSDGQSEYTFDGQQYASRADAQRRLAQLQDVDSTGNAERIGARNMAKRGQKPRAASHTLPLHQHPIGKAMKHALSSGQRAIASAKRASSRAKAIARTNPAASRRLALKGKKALQMGTRALTIGHRTAQLLKKAAGKSTGVHGDDDEEIGDTGDDIARGLAAVFSGGASEIVRQGIQLLSPQQQAAVAQQTDDAASDADAASDDADQQPDDGTDNGSPDDGSTPPGGFIDNPMAMQGRGGGGGGQGGDDGGSDGAMTFDEDGNPVDDSAGDDVFSPPRRGQTQFPILRSHIKRMEQLEPPAARIRIDTDDSHRQWCADRRAEDMVTLPPEDETDDGEDEDERMQLVGDMADDDDDEDADDEERREAAEEGEGRRRVRVTRDEKLTLPIRDSRIRQNSKAWLRDGKICVSLRVETPHGPRVLTTCAPVEDYYDDARRIVEKTEGLGDLQAIAALPGTMARAGAGDLLSQLAGTASQLLGGPLLGQLAGQVGPLVGAFTGFSPVLAGAMSLVQSAGRGDQGARGELDKAAQLAQSGNPAAQKLADVLAEAQARLAAAQRAMNPPKQSLYQAGIATYEGR